MLKLERLVKKFGNTLAVDNLSLKVASKKLVVLLGPSGCGKTTALRIMAGLETPDEGTVHLNGNDITDLPPQERNIAMVFQSYALYTHMKVRENIGYPLKVRGMPQGQREEKVREVAGLLEIGHLLDRKPSMLSGGEQQRVALARALVREPNLFLLDEPLSNVDAKRRIRMRADLKNLQKEVGITTIYVTHDTEEAMAIGDEIVVMNEGKMLQMGTPVEIFDRPTRKFVAGFIGSPSMNFFEGKISRGNGKFVFVGDSFKFPIRASKMVEKASTLDNVTLGIRPEDLYVSNKREDSNVPAKVYTIEPLGSETIISLKVGNQVYKAKMRGKGQGMSLGQKVYLSFDVNDAHLFDQKGERL